MIPLPSLSEETYKPPAGGFFVLLIPLLGGVNPLKKIIGDLLYDTDTATVIFYVFDDNSSEKRVLYRTPNQRYFIHHISTSISDKAGSDPGEYIQVVSAENALHFLVTYGQTETAIEEFPNLIKEA